MGVSAGNPIRTDEFCAQRPFPHRRLPIRVREDEVAAVPRARGLSFFPMRWSRVSIWSNRDQKDRQCEVAHTSPRPRQITYSVTPSRARMHPRCGGSMISGDLCKMSAPRAEVDQRARDTRLGLERIERLLVQRGGPMIAGRAKPSRLWHIRRKAAV